MSDVKQTIQVTNAGLSPILSIAQGTGMVEFEFTVSDFLIPAGSAAVAWNIQPTGNVVSKTCTISGNIITVQPPAYYFLRGKNYMQIQVTGADGVNLFTFLIEVWCSPNISAPVVSQNPDLISQLIQLVGNTEDLETVSKTNLVSAINEIYNRGVVDILDTEEEIEANTDTGKATGALVAKQLISDFELLRSETNGSITYVQGILPSTAGYFFTEVDYPAGFSANNCCVICAAYYNNDYEGYGNIYNSTAPIKWFLLSEKIRVYNILSECTGMTFRIYLQKLHNT